MTDSAASTPTNGIDVGSNVGHGGVRFSQTMSTSQRQHTLPPPPPQPYNPLNGGAAIGVTSGSNVGVVGRSSRSPTPDTYGPIRRTKDKQKHSESENRRRQRLRAKFSALQVAAGVTGKSDRYSILGQAVDKLNELETLITRLENENLSLSTALQSSSTFVNAQTSASTHPPLSTPLSNFQIFENLPTCYISLDGRILDANQAFVTLFQFTEDTSGITTASAYGEPSDITAGAVGAAAAAASSSGVLMDNDSNPSSISSSASSSSSCNMYSSSIFALTHHQELVHTLSILRNLLCGVMDSYECTKRCIDMRGHMISCALTITSVVTSGKIVMFLCMFVPTTTTNGIMNPSTSVSIPSAIQQQQQHVNDSSSMMTQIKHESHQHHQQQQQQQQHQQQQQSMFHHQQQYSPPPPIVQYHPHHTTIQNHPPYSTPTPYHRLSPYKPYPPPVAPTIVESGFGAYSYRATNPPQSGGPPSTTPSDHGCIRSVESLPPSQRPIDIDALQSLSQLATGTSHGAVVVDENANEVRDALSSLSSLLPSSNDPRSIRDGSIDGGDRTCNEEEDEDPIHMSPTSSTNRNMLDDDNRNVSHAQTSSSSRINRKRHHRNDTNEFDLVSDGTMVEQRHTQQLRTENGFLGLSSSTVPLDHSSVNGTTDSRSLVSDVEVVDSSDPTNVPALPSVDCEVNIDVDDVGVGDADGIDRQLQINTGHNDDTDVVIVDEENNNNDDHDDQEKEQQFLTSPI